MLNEMGVVAEQQNEIADVEAFANSDAITKLNNLDIQLCDFVFLIMKADYQFMHMNAANDT